MELSLIEEQCINIKFLAKLGKKGGFSLPGHHWRWVLVLRIRCGAEISKLGVEASRGTENKKVAKIKAQCENNVDCFLWFPGHCSPGICPSRPDSEWKFLRWSFASSQSSCGPSSAGIGTRRQVDPSSRQRACSTSLVVREFLARSSITVTEHPPYSPDLAPCDFFLYPKCKMVLRGRHLGYVEPIKAETTRQMKSLTTEDFLRSYQQWKQRWQKCILSQGEYFEGDHIEIPE